MKIRVTEIEATAEELRQSNTLADSLTNIMRRCFNGVITPEYDEEGEEEGEAEDDEDVRG